MLLLGFLAGILTEKSRLDTLQNEQLVDDISMLQNKVQMTLIAAKSSGYPQIFSPSDIPSLRFYAAVLQSDLQRNQTVRSNKNQKSIYYLMELTDYLLSTDCSDFDRFYQETMPLCDTSIEHNKNIVKFLSSLEKKLEKTN